MEFEGLKSGKTAKFFFSFEKMDVRNLGTYPVELKVQSGDKFSGIQAVLSPMFAQYLPEIKPDGNFSEWEKIEWVNLDTSEDNLVYNKSEKTDGNFKVKFACAWNEEGFALAVEKEDKDFLPPDKTEYNMWMNDSIQVYFDQRKDAEPGLATYGDDDSVYQIGLLRGTPVAYLEQGPEGRYLGPANTVKGVDKDVKVNIRRHDGKTLYEIFFPWKTLKSVKPSTGVTFGFSLFVHDLDPGEDNKRGVSLDKTTPFRHPYVWKDLTLTR
jgi:hypothetical protein